MKVDTRSERKGALNLFAAFDSRSLVWGQTCDRKRQEEFVAFLEYLNRDSAQITQIHAILDNLKCTRARRYAWLAKHPHFVCRTWMDQSGTVV